MFDVLDTDKQPNCADPAVLPLVDEAFARPGGPAGRRMAKELCTGCPIGNECFHWAMTTHEHGMWGRHQFQRTHPPTVPRPHRRPPASDASVRPDG